MIIFLIVLLFSTLILVHEWGHFISARRNGIKIEEFGLGIPPRLVGIYREEKSKKWRIVGPRSIRKKSSRDVVNQPTIYSFNLLPLGGFVRIFGEDMLHNTFKESFASKPAWVKILVLAAGAIMNLIFAAFLFSILFGIGIRSEISQDYEARLTSRGISYTSPVVRVTNIVQGSPAQEAGLRAEDIITNLRSGMNHIDPVDTVNQVQSFVSEHAGEKVEFGILRNREKISQTITPRIDVPEGEGPTGIQLTRTSDISFPWYEAIWKGIVFTIDRAWFIFNSLGALLLSLFMVTKEPIEVAGPVGIVTMAHQFAMLGISRLLYFGAIISISLAVFNLLPIPALDGGRILFVLIGKIRGRAIRPELEQKIHGIAFLLLIVLILVVTWGDISRIFIT